LGFVTPQRWIISGPPHKKRRCVGVATAFGGGCPTHPLQEAKGLRRVRSRSGNCRLLRLLREVDSMKKHGCRKTDKPWNFGSPKQSGTSPVVVGLVHELCSCTHWFSIEEAPCEARCYPFKEGLLSYAGRTCAFTSYFSFRPSRTSSL